MVLLLTVFSILPVFSQAQYGDSSESHLQLISGSINGQSVSASQRIVSVKPEDTIEGSVTLGFGSKWSTRISTPLGLTPTWGNPSTSFRGYGNARGSGEKTINFTLPAPEGSGKYYIIFAYRAEIAHAHVFSMTNWAYDKGNQWGDGNDIASWNQNMIDAANANGRAPGKVLFDGGYKSQYVPATAIEILVAQEKSPEMLRAGPASENLIPTTKEARMPQLLKLITSLEFLPVFSRSKTGKQALP